MEDLKSPLPDRPVQNAFWDAVCILQCKRSAGIGILIMNLLNSFSMQYAVYTH